MRFCAKNLSQFVNRNPVVSLFACNEHDEGHIHRQRKLFLIICDFFLAELGRKSRIKRATLNS
jgi:hypothetical protein